MPRIVLGGLTVLALFWAQFAQASFLLCGEATHCGQSSMAMDCCQGVCHCAEAGEVPASPAAPAPEAGERLLVVPLPLVSAQPFVFQPPLQPLFLTDLHRRAFLAKGRPLYQRYCSLLT